MSKIAAFIYSNDFVNYDWGSSHPLRPERPRLVYELLKAYKVFDEDNVLLVEPRPAKEEELLLIHSPDYIEAVKRFGQTGTISGPNYYGFGYFGDNPVFKGMYEASALYTGASLVAADLVLEGKAAVAFNTSGGLHHAGRDYASGFCIFNDPAIVIAHSLNRVEKIAYIDIDAHHGDGVQNAFYNSNRVLTISIHESGRYLFPGTGEVSEMGRGAGKGYAVNIPLAPGTDDDIFLWAFKEVVPPLLKAFQPQLIVSQLGVDTHYSDPLTDLKLTTTGFCSAVEIIKDYAKKWVALGGGGYSLQVIPRAWALAFSIMVGKNLPDEIPAEYRERYGLKMLRDHQRLAIFQTEREFAQRFAQETAEEIKRSIFPLHKI